MRHRDFKAFLSLFLFSVLLLPIYASQDRPNSSQNPEEGMVVSRYRVIRIDVEVRDGHGNEVKDLTRDDFIIYEDGKKQVLSFWQRIESKIKNEPHTRYLVEYLFNFRKPSGYRKVRVVIHTKDKRKFKVKISPDRYYAKKEESS